MQNRILDSITRNYAEQVEAQAGRPARMAYFDGVIHGVAIYDAALSDADIQAHADAYFTPGGGKIVWVSGGHDYDEDGLSDDYMWVDLLEA